MIWASLAIMICTIVLSAASLRNSRGDALGIPLVALGTFTFLYVIQPLQLIRAGTTELFLSDWQVTKGFLVSAVMLAFFMRGWLHPGRWKPSAGLDWDSRPMWVIGFISACLGLLLYAVFIERSGGIAASFSEAHGHAMKYNDNTAYLYEGPWLILSGSVMMILANARLRQPRWRRLAPYVLLLPVLADAVLTGSRGPLFSVATTYFVGRSLAAGKNVTFRQAVQVLLPLAVGVIAMVGYRSVLHLGPASTQEVPTVADAYNNVAGTSEYDNEHGFAGQEFLLHAATLDTVDQTGKLEWGEGWVEFLVINPIPRLLWPEKSTPPTSGITPADISERLSITMAPGAAAGIVADLYSRFHLLSAIFFYVLGLGLRRLFMAARALNSPLTTVGYIMLYAVSLNMFAQGFGAIFVPFLFSMAPVVLFAWFARRSRRKEIRLQQDMMLRQALALQGERWSS
jgi:hypothetical protein